MTMQSKPEFSRPVAVAELEGDGVAMDVDADAGERGQLAKRFGLLAIDRLTGTARLTPQPGGQLFRLEAEFAADVVQTCVVTLDPLPARVEDSFVRMFSTAAEDEQTIEEHLDLEVEDPPDPIVDGRIDVGEAIAEQLALTLEPFPRKPGISFADYSSPASVGGADSAAGPRDSGADAGPFAALRRLRDKLK